MIGNTLYLVCQHCPSPSDALVLACRAGNDVQYIAESGLTRTDKWFKRHQQCGAGCDKFTVAYIQAKDWDMSPPAEDTVAGSVRMALVNGTEH